MEQHICFFLSHLDTITTICPSPCIFGHNPESHASSASVLIFHLSNCLYLPPFCFSPSLPFCFSPSLSLTGCLLLSAFFVWPTSPSSSSLLCSEEGSREGGRAALNVHSTCFWGDSSTEEPLTAALHSTVHSCWNVWYCDGSVRQKWAVQSYYRALNTLIHSSLRWYFWMKSWELYKVDNQFVKVLLVFVLFFFKGYGPCEVGAPDYHPMLFFVKLYSWNLFQVCRKSLGNVFSALDT